jgi:hypothetical protein
MSNYEGKEKEYPLPASFLEHGARASVTYKLALTLRRGTFAVDTRYVTLSLEGSDSFFLSVCALRFELFLPTLNSDADFSRG